MSTSQTDIIERLLASRLVTKDQLAPFRAASRSAAEDEVLLKSLVEKDLLTPWQVKRLLSGKTAGFFLGNYRLMKPLGAGGMGQVFEAQDTRLRRQIAVKILSPTRRSSTDRERFVREAKASLQLQHENIVRTFEFGQNSRYDFLVMELVDGVNLSQYIRQFKMLNVAQTASIAAQALSAIGYIHRQGIIHRDIKPSNIMITRDGQVKLTDLGLAKSLDGASAEALTRTGAFMGTIDYCAPEQAENPKNALPASDIYALGCSLYHCLCGKAPFAEGTEVQRLVAHRQLEPQRIEELNLEVPEIFANLIHRDMLAKNPIDRFPECEEAAAVFRSYVTSSQQVELETLAGLVQHERLASTTASVPGSTSREGQVQSVKAPAQPTASASLPLQSESSAEFLQKLDKPYSLARRLLHPVTLIVVGSVAFAVLGIICAAIAGLAIWNAVAEQQVDRQEMVQNNHLDRSNQVATIQSDDGAADVRSNNQPRRATGSPRGKNAPPINVKIEDDTGQTDPAPVTTSASSTKQHSTPAIQYLWRKGDVQSYQIDYTEESEGRTKHLSGTTTFRVVSQSGPDRFRLTYHSKFQTITAQSGGTTHKSGRTENGPMTVSSLGEIISFAGQAVLPYGLGSFSRLYIDRITSSGRGNWEVNSTPKVRVSINPNNRIPPRVNGPRFGPRSRFRSPTGFGTTYPAVKRIGYRVGSNQENELVIHKTFDFRTTENATQPYLQVEATGQIVFDNQLGLPKTIQMNGTVTKQQGDNRENFPVTLLCMLRNPSEGIADLQRFEQEQAEAAERKNQEM